MAAYSAFNIPRVRTTKTPAPVIPANVPQHKPFASKRSLQSLAFTPSMESMGFPGPRRLPFVRPDVPPVAGESTKPNKSADAETTAEASFRARPQFRSALEQVSFVTNNKLWDTRQHETEERQQQRPRFGIFGF